MGRTFFILNRLLSALDDQNRTMDNTRDPTNNDHNHADAANNESLQHPEDGNSASSNDPPLSQEASTDIQPAVGEGIVTSHYDLLFSSTEDNALKVSLYHGPSSVFHRPSVRPCVRSSVRQQFL